MFSATSCFTYTKKEKRLFYGVIACVLQRKVHFDKRSISAKHRCRDVWAAPLSFFPCDSACIMITLFVQRWEGGSERKVQALNDW